MTRTARLLTVFLLLLQTLFFAFVSTHRFIDGDEGFYLLASRLVLLHKTPYLDFFYTQAPLLPYIYAAWMKCTQVSWMSAKLLSALLTAILGVELCNHVYRQTRHWFAGLTSVILFAFCTLAFAWFPLVKTYSLAGLLLFSTYLIIVRECWLSRPWILGVAGFLFGLSVSTRSYLLLLLPLFLWRVLRYALYKSRLRSGSWLLGGVVIGTTPCFYLFLLSPDAFLFNNIGYHALRTNAGLLGMWQQKFMAIMVLFLGNLHGNGIQNSILFLTSVVLLLTNRRRNSIPQFAFLVAIAIGAISLLPTPVFPQYFCLCVPFLIVATVCLADDFVCELRSRQARIAAVCGSVVLLVIYVVASIPDFRKYLVTGDGIPSVTAASDRNDWKLPRILEVSQAIDQIVAQGEVVASFFPGDIVATRALPFPGLENDFGLPIADKLSRQQRAQYHILSATDLKADFAAHKPRVVLLRDQVLVSLTAKDTGKWDTGAGFRHMLQADGYIVVRSIGGTSIYVCCSRP